MDSLTRLPVAFPSMYFHKNLVKFESFLMLLDELSWRKAICSASEGEILKFIERIFDEKS